MFKVVKKEKIKLKMICDVFKFLYLVRRADLSLSITLVWLALCVVLVARKQPNMAGNTHIC